MIAPSGGFWPAGSSGGSGVSVFVFQRTRQACLRREQVRRRRLASGLQLPQRRDVVEDPERPAVRADHEVVVLDDEVADRGRRHVQPQRLPALAVVEARRRRPRSVPAKSRPAPHRVLAHGVDEPPSGRPRDDLRPGLAAVARAVDVRPQVVEAEGVDRRVGGAGVEVRGVEQRDLAPRRRAAGGVTSVQCSPPSRVTWIRPSSVPAQMRVARRAARAPACR